ncbi:isoaspartyl peptidase/L-asparaginase family protein [Brevundimonas balnearis]|uniref:Isoaspartyl peptidase/L-asparaginase family protein n=1 Tax=Brevundimonas balnearis TaxID=1572858 RepID=A0ABV6R371_9CAUL
MSRYALILHGGAGARRSRDYSAEVVHMREVVEAMRPRLAQGAPALDVAVQTVERLEASGLYVAGRGASPNTDGVYELDAGLMDGASGRAGAVAALVGFQSPVRAARAVMDRTPHVLLVGDGAARFAAEAGLERIDDPEAWFTRAGQGEDNHPPGVTAGALQHGTVGCCVLDRDGRLAAATSTGGVFGKLPGRVGDTPLIAAGTWADGRVAVSCTGQGEYFIRTAAAARVGFEVEAGRALAEAAAGVIARIGAMGGDGGLIALDRDGNLADPFNSQGMKRAWLGVDGEVGVEVFGTRG